jgi:arylsulfatase A-like enzyme
MMKLSDSGRSLFAFAACLALASGVIEGVSYRVPAVAQFLARQLIIVPRFALWSVPVTNLVWSGLAASVMLGIATASRGRVTLAHAQVVLLGLALGSIGLLYTRVHPASMLIFCTGLAVLSARALGSRWPVRGTGRWVPRLVALVACLAVGELLWGPLHERWTARRLPAAPDGAPNVLLLVWDTVRAFDLSLYGYERETTPKLRRWAVKGAVFDRAISPAPWTLPSHATIFTGRFPHELSVGYHAPLDDSTATLAEMLRARGYATAGFVANMDYCNRARGLARGFMHYEDLMLRPGTLVLASSLSRTLLLSWLMPLHPQWGNGERFGRKDAGMVRRAFLRWLDGREHQRFFAFLNLYDAHHPYWAPLPFDGQFKVEDEGEGREQPDADRKAQQWRIDHANYDESIAYLDDEFDRLMSDLDTRGLLHNTIIIFTSDHGEQFGEHGLRGHGNSLYRQLLQVPLVIWYAPGVPAGTRVEPTASLNRLAATVLELAGLEPGPRNIGPSLVPLWRVPADTAPDPLIYAENRGYTFIQSVIRGDLHYIRDAKHRDRLFDLETDPREERDLAAARPEAVSEFRTLADSVWGAAPH